MGCASSAKREPLSFNIVNLIACAVCFQPGHLWSDAAGWAILVLLLVMVPVFGGLVAFFITIARRAKAAAAAELESLAQQAPTPSVISHENS